MVGKVGILLKEFLNAFTFSFILRSTNEPPRAPGYRSKDDRYGLPILNDEAGGRLQVKLELLPA